LGDLIFAAVNLVRWHKITQKPLAQSQFAFQAAFCPYRTICPRPKSRPADLSLDEMEALWQEAKRK
jgi:uncharacterized protein YabN with tetrapyrrole methylase and pyrophosphatase domain